MKTYDHLGIAIPSVLLPKPDVEMARWAVVACDQYTSEPEYWEKAERLVGSAPSTLRLTFPEVFLGKGDEAMRIGNIHAAMQDYLSRGILVEREGLVYVERTTQHAGVSKTRRGMVLAIDLERYDYAKGSQSLVRATEGTIVERLPPRMRIREGAPMELPHIMILIDDPEKKIIEPLGEDAASGVIERLYDFDLMLGGGHVSGFLVDDAGRIGRIADLLGGLADEEGFRERYHLTPASSDKQVLLFAVGDGNHSLATAKAIWTKIKDATQDKAAVLRHPARYALVEIVNVHDAGLDFEPIHRVLFDVKRDVFSAMQRSFGEDYSYKACSDHHEMVHQVDTQDGTCGQRFGVTWDGGCGAVSIKHGSANLPVGTLQLFLDGFLKDGGAKGIDYVHGSDVVMRLGSERGNVGFYLPAMKKTDLFRTVILDGALPRKTFSMGEAHEKRYYVEARRILP